MPGCPPQPLQSGPLLEAAAVAVAAAAAEAGLNIGGGNPAPPADGEVAAREADFDEDVRPLRVG